MIDSKNFLEGYTGLENVVLETISNRNGLQAQLTNYGARLVCMKVPDKNGELIDVVQGYSNLQGYLNSNEKYFGATIGRYSNRIANGKFSLQNQEYQLATNNEPNHLHGGPNGFHNAYWTFNRISNSIIEFSYLSKDGEEGYPGNLKVTVRYELSDDNTLRIMYDGISDEATPVNLTHHSFFNLNTDSKTSITNHFLKLNADHFLPVDETAIPKGELASVTDTPFDFTKARQIGEGLEESHPQLQLANGYDHCYVIRPSEEEVPLVAELLSPDSGIRMCVYTNEPGIQLYTGNFLDGSDCGKGCIHYHRRSSLCLETQHYPNSPNMEKFPSSILQANEKYKSICIYKFDVKMNNQQIE